MKNIELIDYFAQDPAINPVDSSGGYGRDRALMIQNKDQSCAENLWKEVSNTFYRDTVNSSYVNILDIACGTGRYFNYLHGKNLYGLDASIDMLNLAPHHWGNRHYEKMFLIRDDIHRFLDRPEYQSRFDYVLSVGFLGQMHQTDSSAIIRKIPNLLKKGGRLSLDVLTGLSTDIDPLKLTNLCQNMVGSGTITDVHLREIVPGWPRHFVSAIKA